MIINNNKDEDNSEGVTKALEFGACFVTIGRLSCMTLYVCVCVGGCLRMQDYVDNLQVR